MPYKILNLQLFGEEGAASVDTSADIGASASAESSSEGVATGTEGEQIATASEEVETFDSLIKGKYKKEYGAAVRKAVEGRLKNQRNLQADLDSMNPMIQALAQKYNVLPGVDGKVNIQDLTNRVMDDNALYEQQAFEAGMPIEQFKQMKALERENQMLRMQSQQSAEQRQWDEIMHQANELKEMYPNLDLDVEMGNPEFAHMLATMHKSGFPNALRTTYESIHRDEIMGGAMRYAVQQTNQKISNAIQSGMRRPAENGTGSQAAAQVGAIDPSKLTRDQINEIAARASRGERITFQ